jgi:murein DD-endopeptidase MepM/ murein hydrolase activator NlpD
LSQHAHARTSSLHRPSTGAENLTRSAARRRDRFRRRVRTLLLTGGALTAAAGVVLTAVAGNPTLTQAGLVTPHATQGVTVPEDAAVDFSREPIAPSSPESAPGSTPANEESKVSTLSSGKPDVAPAPAEKPGERDREPEKPAEEPAEPAKPVEEPVEEPLLGPPLTEPSVASPYGNRVNPMGGYGQELHTGTDYAGACGTPVLASSAGTVTESGWHPYGGGQRIVIDHGGGLKTTYNHLSSLGIPVGGKVERGQTIGAVGTTGNSTGCHLHFEVVVDDLTVDPGGYL